MTPESFRQYAPKLIRAASLSAGKENLAHTMSFTRHEVDSGLADFFHDKIRKEMIREYRESEEGRWYLFKPITA